MLKYSYNPFSASLENIGGEDLSALREVSEGWYIDYKEKWIKIADVAKHLSAFANQYGGFLIFGVRESSDGKRFAEEFPGLSFEELEKVSTALREASSAHVNPEVLYEEKVVTGPVGDIGLAEGKSILIAGIPMSYNTPHVHSSGRIYRRLADQSSPKEESDRRILDELWQRGAVQKEKVAGFLKSLPDLPDSQEGSPWLHVYFKPSQTQLMPAASMSFRDFSDIVMNKDSSVLGVHAVLDAVYSTADGFVARQVQKRDPSLASLCFRWWHDGTVRFDIPMSKLLLSSLPEAHENSLHADSFRKAAYGLGCSDGSVVDYSMLIQAVASLTNTYLHLLHAWGDKRDHYSCFSLRGVFHTIPFVDSEKYVEKIKRYSVPVTFDQKISVPQEPDEKSMFFHDSSMREVDFSSSEECAPLPYLYSSMIFFNVLRSVGVVADFDEFMDDTEAWGFDRVNSIPRRVEN